MPRADQSADHPEKHREPAERRTEHRPPYEAARAIRQRTRAQAPRSRFVTQRATSGQPLMDGGPVLVGLGQGNHLRPAG